MKGRERLVQTVWAASDATMVFFAAYVAAWFRFDMHAGDLGSLSLLGFAIVAAGVHLACGLTVGPYRIGHVRGSFEETADLGRSAVVTAVILAALVLPTDWFGNVPRSLPFTVPAFAIVGMFTLRFVVRSYRWSNTRTEGGVHKVIVFGAGEGGRQLVRALQRDSASRFVPVALLDDDPRKRRLKIDGVPVRGGRRKLAAVAETSGADSLVIAMPSADAELVRELRDEAKQTGLDVLILPPVEDFIGSSVASHDLRGLNLEDLLGRRRIQLDTTAIAESLVGKTVLVTGAGGSIGSELARQIARFGPKKLILLDRDESALHAVQMSLTGRALLDDGSLALVDIRDLEALRSLFRAEKPEMVFHAAALKHLTLLEQFPLEAWKTNVLGTLNVLQAAFEAKVVNFVNVSTDKAANPSCVLGYSKRLAERLTADYAHRGDSTFVSVRFGNVLGSRGSVITAFTAQIERGGPITVTHPDVERYFMLIPEACQLVLQASAIGRDGDAMVLEMGTPVKIVDVANTLIDLSGRKDIDIVYTGLRRGEKLSEELFTPGEEIQLSDHPLVNCVGVPAIAPHQVIAANPAQPSDAHAWMRAEATADIDAKEQV